MVDKFEKKLARAERIGRRDRIEHAPPIGMLPGGKLDVVEPGAPPFQPRVAAPEFSSPIGDLDDYDDL